MQKKIKFMIDGKKCIGKEGQTIVEAARDNGVYITTLCYFEGLPPAGCCRICSVKVGGRYMAACTTLISNYMNIEYDTPDLEERRKVVVELLFAEGNHFCPACEKSGNCELQALAYKLRIPVSRFPYTFPNRKLEATHPRLMVDWNRCVLCKRCIRAIKTPDGKNVFSYSGRGNKNKVVIDREAVKKLDYETLQTAMNNCPVGAIIVKEKGFKIPIGERKFDKEPIGTEIEK